MKTKILSLPDLKKAGQKKEIESVPVCKPTDYLLSWGRDKTFAIRTYGCQANVRDSEIIRNYLLSLGMKEKEDFSGADFVLFNTCAIRENAENHLYGELGLCKKAYDNKRDMIIAVCGCVVQEEEATRYILEHFKHVSLIFGTSRINSFYYLLQDCLKEKMRIVDVSSTSFSLLKEPIGSVASRFSKHKAFVNIMYGCDKFCTYCIVPYTRGRERSRDKEDIIKEVEELIKLGYKEVTLLGQNVDAYGKDKGEKYAFASLLEEVAKTGIKRIRFTTPYPSDFNPEVFQVMAKYNNIMPSIHLPIQSGSDEILKKMNRRYTSKEYLDIVKLLREKLPNVALTTDIIVGFPNETEEDFLKTLDIVNEVKYDSAYTFIYSKRPGTPASKLYDNVSDSVKHERFDRLKKIIDFYAEENAKKYVGKTTEVLFDTVSKRDKTMISGYNPQGKLVHVKGDESILGQIRKVEIHTSHTYSLIGEIKDE